MVSESQDSIERNHFKNHQQFIKQQQQIERMKVQKIQKKCQNQQKNQRKKKLKAQIFRKKKQLNLIKQKQAFLSYQDNKGDQIAKIKQQQNDQLKRQKQRQTIYNSYKHQKYFQNALKRLQIQNFQKKKKERQAYTRRKVFQKVAIKNVNQLERKKLNLQHKFHHKQSKKGNATFIPFKQSKINSTNYRQSMSRKTKSQQNIVIYSQDKKQINQSKKINANRQAYQMQEQHEKKKKLNAKKKEEDLKKINERGQIALQKKRKQAQYSQYILDSQKNRLNYNLHRIKTGLVHQKAGIKPMTLNRIAINKQVRSQIAFENMFCGKKISYNQTVTPYQVKQSVNRRNKKHKYYQPLQRSKQRESQSEQDSKMAQISSGKYSFEEKKICFQNEQQILQNADTFGIPEKGPKLAHFNQYQYSDKQK